MIGILGGMGPAATVDLMDRIVKLTKAKSDSDHVPILAMSDPAIPPLGPAILHDAPTPLPDMLVRLAILEAAGVDAIAIACHAAHHWYDSLAAASSVTIIHIADAVIADLQARSITVGPIGIVAATSTVKSGFYQKRLSQAGYSSRLPSNDTLENIVQPAIAQAKTGNLDAARPLFERAIKEVAGHGVSAIVLACTEIPVALGGATYPHLPPLIDGTQSLARACIIYVKGAEALAE